MQRADFRFTFPFRVRFSEVDKQGIVFNVHYLVYFDTAISEYFRALPFDVETQLIPNGTDVFMVKMQLEFFVPLHFDDEIEVGVRSRRVGRSSLTFELAVFSERWRLCAQDQRNHLGECQTEGEEVGTLADRARKADSGIGRGSGSDRPLIDLFGRRVRSHIAENDSTAPVCTPQREA